MNLRGKSRGFKQLTHLIRAEHWFSSFIPMIIGLCFFWILLFKIPFNIQIIIYFFLFIISTIGLLSLGYLINEFFDIEHDEKGGKTNRLSNANKLTLISLLTFCVGFSFLPWIWLPTNLYTWLFLILEIILFCLYSLPIIRLKNIWYLAGFVDSLYAYVIIPIFLSLNLFSFFTPFHTPLNSIILISLSFFIIGYRNILIHHLHDINSDKLAGIVTIPIKVGKSNTYKLIYVFIACESIFYVSSLLFFTIQNKLVYILIIIYFTFLFTKIIRSINTKLPIEKLIFSEAFPNYYYQFLFPLSTLLLLIFVDFRWSILFIFYFTFLVQHFKIMSFLNFLKKLFYFSKIGLIVNYLIYYLFLLFGVNLKKENKSAISYLRDRFKPDK